MQKELVLAVYSRDYSWIREINETVRITRYTKNTTIQPYETFLPNVGRCVHTFFNHIYQNYHCLADYTFFSQDMPFDHISNYLEIINGERPLWDKVAQRKTGECWFFTTQFNDVLDSDAIGGPHHPGLPIVESWNMFFEDPFPGIAKFVGAGHFCVSRNHIQQIPRKFFWKIVNFLETHELAPWVIERLELYIFENSMKRIND